MRPSWKLRMMLFVGLLFVVLGRASSASDAAAGVLPKDPCSLLATDEIQVLAPKATIGPGEPDDSMAPIGTGCTFRWGPKTAEWGDPSLTLAVIDASKGWPGVSPEQLREGLLAKVKVGAPHASTVPGLGDAAAFTFEERTSNASVEAYFRAKGVLVAITLHAGDSLSTRNQLISLVKAAAARI